MKKYVSPLLMLVLATFVLAPGWAQAGSGFYLSSDIGLNVASGISTTGRSNDRASVCDEYINPRYAEVDGLLGNDECLGPNPGEGDDWDSGFDSATGILAGAAVGYSFAGQNSSLGGLRVELEYFYRQSNYDQTNYLAGGDAGGVSGDKLGGEGDIREVVLGTDRIGSVSSHNLFANLYYDFANTSRFTPYIGIGGGLGITDMEYGSVWARNPYADRIPTGAGLPNADEIRQNLAGTVSVEDVTLSDTLWGFQFLFGVDYALTDAMSLGLKGRYVMFDSFDSGDGSLVWDPLRGHPPYLRENDTEHVSGAVSTNNIQFFGISLNLKYHF